MTTRNRLKAMTMLAATACLALTGCQPTATAPDSKPAATEQQPPAATEAKVSEPKPVAPKAPAKAAAAKNNLVKNGSLDQGTEGWKEFRAAISRAQVKAQDGEHALKVDSTEDLYGGVLYACEKENAPDGSLAIKGGQAYHASVYVKGLSAFGNVDVQLQVVDDLGTPYGPAIKTLTDQWQRIDCKFKAVPGAKTLGLRVLKRKEVAKASFLVDALSLVEIPAGK